MCAEAKGARRSLRRTVNAETERKVRKRAKDEDEAQRNQLTITRNVVRLTDLPAAALAVCIRWAILALFLSTMALSQVSRTRLATDDDRALAAAVEGDADATDCGDFIADKECTPLVSSPWSTQKSSSDGGLAPQSSRCDCLSPCCGVWGGMVELDSPSFSC